MKHKFEIGDKVRVKTKSYFVKQYGKNYDRAIPSINSQMERFFGVESTVTNVLTKPLHCGNCVGIMLDDKYRWLPEWVTPVKDKEQLYRCNAADKCYSTMCKHKEPHKRKGWLDCSMNCRFDSRTYEAKCIPYKEQHEEKKVKEKELSLEEQLKKLQDERESLELKEKEVFRERSIVIGKIVKCQNEIKEEKDRALEKLNEKLVQELKEIFDEIIFIKGWPYEMAAIVKKIVDDVIRKNEIQKTMEKMHDKNTS